MSRIPRLRAALAATAVAATAIACRDEAPTQPLPPAAPAAFAAASIDGPDGLAVTSVGAANAADGATGDGASGPGAPAGPRASAAPSPAAMAGMMASMGGRFIATPYGTQPAVTPQLRIVRPRGARPLRANQPIRIRVQYKDFDMQPDLRTPNAGESLGSLPQELTDGFVQGHVHGYLQALPRDGSFPDVNATSFCVLTNVVVRRGFDGVVEGECPGVPRGRYRLSVEFQTNSHTAVLKDGPRAVPTSDVMIVRVR